ncbi:MAG TPA: FTR1 family protein, partial [Thermoanaerobaculia bacterium]|nr:FTR1 family protein [Thermoanaerobaculia bacterium]
MIVTLREGIEAALMVGIIVAFLRKEGNERFLGAVWAGIAAAAAASLAGSLLLYRVTVNEEVLEGLLYVASAVLVATLLLWMWRHSHAISGQMKGSLARILARERPGSVAAGLFLFTFLMIFREGVETVLFLSALSLTTTGLLAVLGALVGLAAAAVFGVLFVRGSVRVDLGRFFTITGIALLIFLLQLLLNGYHELSEAGWLAANPTTMATIGPLVKNEFFFVLAVLALPLLMLLVPGRAGRSGVPAVAGAEGASSPAHAAAGRLERAAERRQGRARVLGGTLGIAILAALGLGFVYSRPPAA